jgi:hypothetical protein
LLNANPYSVQLVVITEVKAGHGSAGISTINDATALHLVICASHHYRLFNSEAVGATSEQATCTNMSEASNSNAPHLDLCQAGGAMTANSVTLETTISFKHGSQPTNLWPVSGSPSYLPAVPRIATLGG